MTLKVLTENTDRECLLSVLKKTGCLDRGGSLMKDEELTAEELLAEIDRILGKEKTPKESFEVDTPDYEELMKETDRVLSELHTQEPEQKETPETGYGTFLSGEGK